MDSPKPKRRVLIVDRSAETREVLTTLLARHGHSTTEAHRPELAVTTAESVRPDLIVLDGDSDRTRSHEATAELIAFAARTNTPVVYLGHPGSQPLGLSSESVVAKPYRWESLLRRIESEFACRRAA